MTRLLAGLLLASLALSACAAPRRLMEGFDEARAKTQVEGNVQRLVKRLKSEQGRLPSQAQCEDIAGAAAAQALFYSADKAPSDDINTKSTAIVSEECRKSLTPEPAAAGAPAFDDAAAQKQVEQSIEKFKKANNGRLPNLDECEVSAGKVATAALLGNNPDQDSQLRLQGKVHDECLAQLNGSEGGEANTAEGQQEGGK